MSDTRAFQHATGWRARVSADEGIQLAWDDEDILEGQNRSLGAPPDGEDPVLILASAVVVDMACHPDEKR